MLTPTKPAQRPLMAAVAAQQKALQATQAENARLVSAIQTIAHYAGLGEKVADILNPASPVADPADEKPFQSTEEALGTAVHDDPRNLGTVPGANENVAADATTTALTPGTSIPTGAFNVLEDVTAPVTDTKTHIAPDQTRIEVDVRVGNPDDPNPAFPLQGEFANAQDTGGSSPDLRSGASRTFNAIKLARLRKAAGIETGDELEVAGRIETEAGLTDAMIAYEINVLSKVRSTASRQAGQAPRNLVPRTGGVQRTVPSLAPQPGLGQTVASVGDADTQDSDLFWN